MERNDPMTMSRLKAYRRNASAIEDIKAELSGKYVADSISVCTPPSYTPHSTRIDGFLPKRRYTFIAVRTGTARA